MGIEIWFWQRILSPHMFHLAKALASAGIRTVYLVEESLSEDRLAQGWCVPEDGNVNVKVLHEFDSLESLVLQAPETAIHICQGLRKNGVVAEVQALLQKHNRRQWVILETINDSGFWGFLKRLEYKRLAILKRGHIEVLLAIGGNTPEWLMKRGFKQSKIFPFAYFLDTVEQPPDRTREKTTPFAFLTVGQFIFRKRLDLILDALATLKDVNFTLGVAGTGPQEPQLKATGIQLLGSKLNWIGKVKHSDMPMVMKKADCLILASEFDGFGAVASEALIVGTPVICSNQCGVYEIASTSGHCAIFEAGDKHSLIRSIRKMFERGPISIEDRYALAEWATCLTAESGAQYLLDIVGHVERRLDRPEPPWLSGQKDMIAS